LGTRSHTTFKKRQKEQARSEKAREKAEERAQRKLEKTEGGPVIDGTSDLDDHSLDVLDLSSLGIDEDEAAQEPSSRYPRPR